MSEDWDYLAEEPSNIVPLPTAAVPKDGTPPPKTPVPYDTARIVVLPGECTLPIDVERVLDGARGAEAVVVVSRDEEGSMTMATSESDSREIYWMLSWAKGRLMNPLPARALHNDRGPEEAG